MVEISGDRGVLGVIASDLDEAGWDDVVDVICVGPSMPALAAAIAADQAGLNVLLTGIGGRTDAETLADRLGLVGDAAEYLGWVAADTGPPAPSGVDLPVRVSGQPLWPDAGPGISFSGAALRDWAGTCLASPYGLLCTAVARADSPPVPVGVIDAGQAVDVGNWLQNRAREFDITAREHTAVSDLVVVGGQVVGAVIAAPEGETVIRTTLGVVMPTGRGRLAPPVPVSGGAAGAQLVLVVRPFSRFARVELLI